nr:glutathione peroxidase [Tanacetum cinerariifolium]
SIDYTLTNDAGEVIDSSAGGAPLVYLQGAGNIIPGLEKALEGKDIGDELKVSIEPEDAYGEYSAELVSTLNRSMFEGVDELEVGMQFHASAPDGGNHPLAGQRLNFQVKIVAIRDASEEEMAHGHVHGEGEFVMSIFHDLKLKALDGQELPLAPLKGKVVLVVNVASKCGLTPQYAALENLYQKYKDRGFSVLGLPCNQFAGQEPGTQDEIQAQLRKRFTEAALRCSRLPRAHVNPEFLVGRIHSRSVAHSARLCRLYRRLANEFAPTADLRGPSSETHLSTPAFKP